MSKAVVPRVQTHRRLTTHLDGTAAISSGEPELKNTAHSLESLAVPINEPPLSLPSSATLCSHGDGPRPFQSLGSSANSKGRNGLNTAELDHKLHHLASTDLEQDRKRRLLLALKSYPGSPQREESDSGGDSEGEYEHRERTREEKKRRQLLALESVSCSEDEWSYDDVY